MKKVMFIAALFLSMAANAQQFGVIGGMSLSKMDGSDNIKNDKNAVQYQAGVVYKADLGAGFAVQPSLTYQVKGANIDQGNDVVSKSKTGFVELGIGAQWGPDLLAFRPFLFVEPFVGYGVTGEETVGASSPSEKYGTALTQAKNKLEYGVGAGIGLEITSHIQLSWQLYRNFGALYTQDGLAVSDLSLVNYLYKDLKNYQGMKLSLAILF